MWFSESQVLLKNSGHLLPLSSHAKVYVAGSNADDVGNQSGGWTLTWQGQSGAIPGGTSILQGMVGHIRGKAAYVGLFHRPQ